MTEEIDPLLREIFAAAEQPLPPEQFVRRLEQRMAQRRKVIRRARALAGISILALAWLLAGPLQAMGLAITQALNAPLFADGPGGVATTLLPLNTLAAPAGLCVLLLWLLFRKLLSH